MRTQPGNYKQRRECHKARENYCKPYTTHSNHESNNHCDKECDHDDKHHSYIHSDNDRDLHTK